MDDYIFFAAAEIIIAFIVTFFLTPRLIKLTQKRGIMGRDQYKTDHPEVSEMGGVSIMWGYIFGLLLVIPFLTDFDQYHILAALGSILIISLIAMMDDLFGLSHSFHLLLPLIAAVPLMVTFAGTPSIDIPFYGPISVRRIYPLILIPIGITAAANLTNMLAGFNGMESGSGAVICSALILAGVILTKPEVVIIVAPLLGALLGFLIYNWYPAKIFPGDSGTLIIGTTIAAAVIVGNMEMVGVLLLSIYILNFLMYMAGRSKFKKHPDWKFGKVDKDGILHPPAEECWYSLYFFLPKYFKLTEKGITKVVIGLQVIVSVIVLAWVLTVVYL